MHSGMDLRRAIAEAQELGFQVRKIRNSGEILFRHILLERPIRVNVRRKDAPRKLTRALRRVEEGTE